jgi:hypothetical protein
MRKDLSVSPFIIVDGIVPGDPATAGVGEEAAARRRPARFCVEGEVTLGYNMRPFILRYGGITVYEDTSARIRAPGREN